MERNMERNMEHNLEHNMEHNLEHNNLCTSFYNACTIATNNTLSCPVGGTYCTRIQLYQFSGHYSR